MLSIEDVPGESQREGKEERERERWVGGSEREVKGQSTEA